jgi:aspartate racemase
VRTVGVLGGMGPLASCRFLEWLLAAAREDWGAERNDQFPHVLLSSLPVSDLVETPELAEATVQRVEAEAEVLARAGADFLVMPCHTMHLFLPRIQSRARRPFLSMVDLAGRELRGRRPHRVGILATPTTIARGLYDGVIASAGAEVVLPGDDDVPMLTDLVFRGIAGEADATDGERLEQLLSSLRSRGADTLLLACTELSSLLVAPNPQVVDPLRLLVGATCEAAFLRQTALLQNDTLK